MSLRSLKDMPVNEPVKSKHDLLDIRKKLAGLIVTGEIHNFREGGMMQVIHLLAEEIATLKEEVTKLKNEQRKNNTALRRRDSKKSY